MGFTSIYKNKEDIKEAIKNYYDKYGNIYTHNFRSENKLPSIKLVCKYFGTVSNAILECGIKPSHWIKTDEELLELLSYDTLYDLYCIKLIGITEISKIYKVNKSRISKLLSLYNIKKRNNSEIMNNYYSNNEDAIKIKSEQFKSVWQNEESRKRILDYRKNPLYGISISAGHQGIPIEKWNGHVSSDTKKIRNSDEYKQWRLAIYRRDNFTCQCCGDRREKGNRIILHAHHKENFADTQN